MSSSYQPNIPTGNVPLNQDYLNILGNFQQLDTSFGTDHVAFSQALNNGYHTVIRQVTQGSDPSTIAGTNQLYSKTVAGDTALFMKSGNGVVQQLSGAFTPSGNGSVTLPGGIIMKWGTVTATIPTNSSVTFPTAFPNNCFVVNPATTISGVNSGVANANIIGTPSTTAFNFYYNSNGPTSGFNGFTWIAIGN